MKIDYLVYGIVYFASLVWWLFVAFLSIIMLSIIGRFCDKILQVFGLIAY